MGRKIFAMWDRWSDIQRKRGLQCRRNEDRNFFVFTISRSILPVLRLSDDIDKVTSRVDIADLLFSLLWYIRDTCSMIPIASHITRRVDDPSVYLS